MEKNALISPNQFGFRRQHSTIDQLICTYNDVTSSRDLGEIVDLVFFDYAKAFDKVSHQVLLSKLRAMGVSSQLTTQLD